MFLSHFRQSSQNWMQSYKHVVRAVESGLPVFSTGDVLIDVNKHGCVFFLPPFPARNALISTDQVVSGCFYSVDPYTSRAGKFIFHPEVLLGLSGEEKKNKTADLKPKPRGEVYGKTSQHFQNGSTFAGCFLFFFLPSFTERRRRRGGTVSKGMSFWLNAATSVLQNVIVSRA